MLKITMQNESDGMTLKLEGRLVGPWVKELELFWNSSAETRRIHPVRVDLTSVSFIDSNGKDLLKVIHWEGADLVASGCLNQCIVEEILQSEKKRE